MDARVTGRRGWIAIAIAVGVLLLGGVVWSLVAAGADPSITPSPAASGSEDGSAAPAPTSAASPTPTPVPTPGTPAATPPPPPATAGPPASDAPIAPEAPAVAPTDPAEQAGVVVELVRVERVQGVAAAPGEISGPAVRLTVRITNGSSKPIDAGLVAVNVYYGAARDPAPSIMQPGGEPFAGSIASGESATGVYLFEGDGVELADTLVGVDAVPGEPTFTFRGDLR